VESAPPSEMRKIWGLAAYHDHLGQIVKRFVKDPVQHDEQLCIVRRWKMEVEQLDPQLRSTVQTAPNSSLQPTR
jgi:hypothetical protein